MRALHYIVDKPWAKRIATDGVAGYLGNDGVMRGWWWEIWAQWEGERKGEEELLSTMEQLVAGELDEEGTGDRCRSIRRKVCRCQCKAPWSGREASCLNCHLSIIGSTYIRR